MHEMEEILDGRREGGIEASNLRSCLGSRGVTMWRVECCSAATVSERQSRAILYLSAVPLVLETKNVHDLKVCSRPLSG